MRLIKTGLVYFGLISASEPVPFMRLRALELLRFHGAIHQSQIGIRLGRSNLGCS